MKNLKKWLFKKIFKYEVMVMEQMLNNQKSQIENLKKRVREMDRTILFLNDQIRR